MRGEPPFSFPLLMGVLLTLLAAGTVWQLQPSSEASVPLAAFSRGVPVWAPQFMAGQGRVARDDAVAAARRFDVIASLKGTYRRHVTAMKQVNPGLRLLVYVNAAFAQRDQGTTYPKEWYARDGDGEKIRSNRFGTYLMDVSNPGWADDLADRCERFLSLSGYNGCLLDVLGGAPLSSGYVSGLPVNPATGKPWSRADWMEATMRLAKLTRSRVEPKLVVGNGLADGPRFFRHYAPTAALMDWLDGGVAEQWLRHPSQPLYSYGTEAGWKQNVDMLADAGEEGRWLLTLTKVWAPGTDAEKDAWHRYALASFLLGTDGRSLFSFVSGRDHEDATRVYRLWDMDIGAPSGDYGKKDGVYQRTFARGKVLVNPTGMSRAVSLEGTYTSLNGNRVSTLQLGPHSAEILTSSK